MIFTLSNLTIFSIVLIVIIIGSIPVLIFFQKNKKWKNSDFWFWLKLEDSDLISRRLFDRKKLLRVRWGYCLLVSLLSFFGILTIRNSYLYPKGTSVFNNTDYHALMHKGYAFKDSFNLVDKGRPEIALWDTKEGKVTITKANSLFQMDIESFPEPLYYYEHGSSMYKLANAPLPQDFSYGVKLKLDQDSLCVRIIQDKDNFRSARYLISFNDQSDTIAFNKRLFQGYNDLLDIVSTGRGLNLPPRWSDYLDGTLLARGEIPVDQKFVKENEGIPYLEKIRITNESQLSALRLFPGPAISKVRDMQYQDLEGVISYWTPQTVRLHLNSGSGFYTGVGGTSRTHYLVSAGERSLLLFDRPTAYELPDEDLKLKDLFIASDLSKIPEVVDKKGGYFFQEISVSDNIHHISGNILYRPGSAREVLVAKISDDNSGNGLGEIISTNEETEFYLTTKKTNFSWIMELKNFRKDHRMQYMEMILPLILYPILVILWTFLMSIKKFFKAFISVSSLYWALLIFIIPFYVIRTIMLWRLGAFPLLDTGSAYEYYAYLFNGEQFFRVTVIALSIFLGFIFLFPPINSWLRAFGLKRNSRPLMKIIESNRWYIKSNTVLRNVIIWQPLSEHFNTSIIKDFLAALAIPMSLLSAPWLGINLFSLILVFISVHYLICRISFQKRVENVFVAIEAFSQDKIKRIYIWRIVNSIAVLVISLLAYPTMKYHVWSVIAMVWSFRVVENMVLYNIRWKKDSGSNTRQPKFFDWVVITVFLLSFLASSLNLVKIVPFWLFYLSGIYLVGRLEMPNLLTSQGDLNEYGWRFGKANSLAQKISGLISRVYARVSFHFFKISLSVTFLILITIFDSGYLIIAGSFVLLYWTWSYLQNKKRDSVTKILFGLSSSILFLFLLIFQHKIVVRVWDHVSSIGLYSISLLSIILFCVFVSSLRTSRRNQRSGKYRFRFVLIWSAVIGISMISIYRLTSLSENVQAELDERSHIKYRSLVFGDAGHDELIQEVKIDSYGMQQLQRITHSASMIHYYGSLYEKGGSHFQPQPHDNYGATYNTQTTDLVTSRYVLAEHGSGVLVGIGFLIFLIALYSFARAPNPVADKSYRLVGYAPSLILLITYVIIFLVNTNRIPFVGQDILFISLFSNISMALPLAILISAIALEAIWRNEETDELAIGRAIQGIGVNQWGTLFVIFVFAIGIFLFVLISPNNPRKEQILLSESIDRLARKVQKTNNLFIQFQDKQLEPESSVSAKGGLNVQSPDSVFSLFMKEEGSNVLKIFNSPISADANAQSGIIAKQANIKFDSSAFALFNIEKDKQNIKNLLHLVKRNDRHRLRLNRQHFFIKIPEANAPENWQGNIVAQNFMGDAKEVLVNKTMGRQIFPTTPGFEENLLSDATGNYLNPGIANIRINKIPASWVYGNNDAVFVDMSGFGESSANRAVFSLFDGEKSELYATGKDNERQSHQFLSLRLDSKDKLNITSGTGEIWEVGLKKRHHSNYLARQFVINGKNKRFYPLGDKFGWVYHYANLVESAYSRNENDLTSDLILSLDYKLIESFHYVMDSLTLGFDEYSQTEKEELTKFHRQLLEQPNPGGSAFSIDPSGRKVLFNGAETNLTKALSTGASKSSLLNSVTTALLRNFEFNISIIDGDGKIRAIYDFSENFKVDPNDINYYNAYLANLYRDSNYEDERRVLGNKNLLIMNEGVGSSIKPIMYAALTSQYKSENWHWKDISWRLAVPKKDITETRNNTDYITYWGGHKHTSATIDIGSRGLSGSDYLIWSNNVTHSIMLFLGSQFQSELGNLDDILKVTASKPNSAKVSPKLRFPEIRINDNWRYIDKSWLNEEGEVPDNSMTKNNILSQGLRLNFNLLTVGRNRNDLDYRSLGDDGIYLSNSELKERQGSFYWSYPEGSGFWGNERTDFRSAINNPTLGGYPLRMTSLKMAEMGVRLFRNKKLEEEGYSILADSPPLFREQTPSFEIHAGWEGQSYQEHLDDIKSQMNEVLLSGTGKGLGKLLNNKTDHPYKYYAKTGTSTFRGGGDINKRNKYLFFIIQSKENPSKLFSCHMTFHGIEENVVGEVSSLWYQRIIRVIENSESFQYYFNSND